LLQRNEDSTMTDLAGLQERRIRRLETAGHRRIDRTMLPVMDKRDMDAMPAFTPTSWCVRPTA
jgi:hypothetical protein